MYRKVNDLYIPLPLQILYVFKRSGKNELSFQEIVEAVRRDTYISGEIEDLLPAIMYLVENRFIEKTVSNDLVFKISTRGLQIVNLFEKIVSMAYSREAEAK
ncbi:MAG: hypothetical protein ACP5I7_00530 [Sulfolobales archaeon]|jgi:hypothetical protein